MRILLICSILIGVLACQRQDRLTPSAEAKPETESPKLTKAAPVTHPATTHPATQTVPAVVQVAGVATCRPAAEAGATLSRLIELGDSNGDGQVSRNEAASLANFLVGGFFFRADENGDAIITPAEGREAREEVMNQHPALATLLKQAQKATGQSPFAAAAQILDIEYGKPISAATARDAAKGAVDDLFRLADEDSDKVITLAEARAASWQSVRAVGHAAFKAADSNSDAKLTPQEFESAVDAPLQAAFRSADTNSDERLTEGEAAVAMGYVAKRFGIPSPPPGK